MTFRYPKRWLEFVDSRDPDKVIACDLDFLTSNYRCIWNDGCRANDHGAHYGCCNVGAYFTDDESHEGVAAHAKLLGPDDADNWKTIQEGKWLAQPGGKVRKTRVIDGACIFLNRGKSAAPVGCSLDVMSMKLGMKRLGNKPSICSTVPLHVSEEYDDYIVLSAFDEDEVWVRNDNHAVDEHPWWCVNAPEAYTHHWPVYIHMRDEIEHLIGEDNYMKLLNGIMEEEKPRPQGVPVFIRSKIELQETA